MSSFADPKEWPANPGLCIRDFRTRDQWRKATETKREEFTEEVWETADGMNAISGVYPKLWSTELVSLAMACYEQEGGPTRLAVDYFNLYGIIWSDTAYNRATYPAVRFAGNDHDKSVGIPTRYYRVYPSIHACLENWYWHLTQSGNYKHLWPMWQAGQTKDYVQAFRMKWANGNDDDPPAVMANWRKWMDRLGADSSLIA